MREAAHIAPQTWESCSIVITQPAMRQARGGGADGGGSDRRGGGASGGGGQGSARRRWRALHLWTAPKSEFTSCRGGWPPSAASGAALW